MAGQGRIGCRVPVHDDMTHHCFYIDDGKLGPMEMSFVAEAKDVVAVGIKANRKILVRCQMGLNRSGLVVALALVDLGFSAQLAINWIRRKRNPDALCNPWFVEYIHNYYAHVGKPSQEEGTGGS